MSSSFLLPLVLIVLAVPLFLSARKQKRQLKQMQTMQSSLTEGDRVMTTSGMYATVVGYTDDTIDLEIAEGVVATWVRAAVREKVATESDTEVDEDEGHEEHDATDAAHGTEAAVAHSESPAVHTESSAELAPPLEQGNKSS